MSWEAASLLTVHHPRSVARRGAFDRDGPLVPGRRLTGVALGTARGERLHMPNGRTGLHDARNWADVLRIAIARGWSAAASQDREP